MSSRTRRVDASTVIQLFHQVFAADHDVRLEGGASEPLYEPGSNHQPALILFRDDYPASAMHEIAHWCLAGPARRLQTDYGYWYMADRDAEAQTRFEAAEVRPQALEWIFCQSAGIPYRVSCDNFDADIMTAQRLQSFRTRVRDAARHWLTVGLTQRAARFATHLVETTGRHHALCAHTYRELPR